MGDWLELNKEHEYVQDNRLVTAQYSRSISVIGQKLVRIAITNINSVLDDEFFTYKCRLIDLVDMMELNDNQAKNIYRDIKKASAEVLETKILIEQEGGKKKGSFRRYNLFSYFDYNDGSGTVTIKFNEDMRPFLLRLKGNFTKIQLEDVLMFQHKYSIRLFELIQMELRNKKPYADKHYQVELSLEQIRKATNTENVYKQIGEFRRFVLSPSLDDINGIGGYIGIASKYHVEVQDIKEGRKVVGFLFDLWSGNTWNIMQARKGQLDGQMSIFEMDGGED